MRTEWIILADRAEVIGGRLFLMGGGWEAAYINTPDMTHTFGVAVAWSVPWSEAAEPHVVELEIAHAEKGSPLLTIEATLDIGRPAGLPHGQSQLAQMAATVDVSFGQFGEHEVIVRVDGYELARRPFRIERGKTRPASARM